MPNIPVPESGFCNPTGIDPLSVNQLKEISKMMNDPKKVGNLSEVEIEKIIKAAEK